MLIAINDRLDNIQIQALIEYSVFSDQEQLDKAIEMYKANQHMLMGYSLGDTIIGIIGYASIPDNTVKINHISVRPENRGMSYGRLMISELIDLIKPRKIIVETEDADVLDFYRNIGFEITSLGEKYPSIERFECAFITDFYENTEC